MPFALAVVTMGGLWWYVVIHKKSIDAPEVAGLQPLGGAAVQAEAADEGTSTAFYIWFAAIAALWLLASCATTGAWTPRASRC